MKGGVPQHCQPGTGSVGVIAMMAAFLVVGPTMTWAGKEKSGLRPPSVNKISEGRHRDFPLKHTDVKVAISEFLSRVRSGLPASSWGPGLPERGSMRGCRILGGRTEGDRLLGLWHLGGPREQHALLHREQRRIHGAIHGRWG